MFKHAISFLCIAAVSLIILSGCKPSADSDLGLPQDIQAPATSEQNQESQPAQEEQDTLPEEIVGDEPEEYPISIPEFQPDIVPDATPTPEPIITPASSPVPTQQPTPVDAPTNSANYGSETPED